MARRGTMPTLDISRIKGRDLSKAIDIKAYAKKTRYGIHPWTNGVKSNSVKSNSVKSNRVKSVKSRIAGATKTYLGTVGGILLKEAISWQVTILFIGSSVRPLE